MIKSKAVFTVTDDKAEKCYGKRQHHNYIRHKCYNAKRKQIFNKGNGRINKRADSTECRKRKEHH